MSSLLLTNTLSEFAATLPALTSTGTTLPRACTTKSTARLADEAVVEKKDYVAGLIARGIAVERILTYGIAFRGKEVLVALGARA